MGEVDLGLLAVGSSGLSDAGLWAALLSFAAAVVAGVVRIIMLRIRTKADHELAKLALERAPADQVASTLDALARFRQFNAGNRWWPRNRAIEPDDDDPPPRPIRRGRRR